MKYDREKHHRKSIRLRGYDYASAGAYFITICTHQRQCLFGDIINGAMQLSKYGAIAATEWVVIPNPVYIVYLFLSPRRRTLLL